MQCFVVLTSLVGVRSNLQKYKTQFWIHLYTFYCWIFLLPLHYVKVYFPLFLLCWPPSLLICESIQVLNEKRHQVTILVSLYWLYLYAFSFRLNSMPISNHFQINFSYIYLYIFLFVFFFLLSFLLFLFRHLLKWLITICNCLYKSMRHEITEFLFPLYRKLNISGWVPLLFLPQIGMSLSFSLTIVFYLNF